jgi:hypothetical protein
MAGPIDSTLDELDTRLRELKREVARLEAFRRRLGAAGASPIPSGPVIPEEDGIGGPLRFDQAQARLSP